VRAAAFQKYISYIQAIITALFEYAAKSVLFAPQNAVYCILLSCLVHVVQTFYVKGALKFGCPPPAFQGVDPLDVWLHIFRGSP
jgi:hypothetical protein